VYCLASKAQKHKVADQRYLKVKWPRAMLQGAATALVCSVCHLSLVQMCEASGLTPRTTLPLVFGSTAHLSV
jgi:hypothetical protein